MGQDSEPDSRPSQILLAERHPAMRESIESMLAIEPGVKVERSVGTLPGLLESLYEQPFDVLVLDYALVEGTMTNSLRSLRATHPSVRVIVIGVKSIEALRPAAISAGASDFLTKSRLLPELGNAIRRT